MTLTTSIEFLTFGIQKFKTMIPYQITIPTEKKALNQKMQLLAMGSGVWYTIDRTENDTVYNIEFELQNEFDLFKETVEKAIPDLF